MIHSKPNPLLALLLLALSPAAAALQIVDAGDGETVLARISQREITRISVERGRMRKVTGNAGEFLLEKDDERGQVFIRPASPDSTKPINLFVSSERGTVALLLQPVDMPSDTIVIREARKPSAVSRLERSSVHVRVLKNLLLTMASDALPDDMEIREPRQELALWPGVRLILQRIWRGESVVGEKYQLANVGTAVLELAERDLYKPGVMSVSVEATRVPPGEATNLFVIRERGYD